MAKLRRRAHTDAKKLLGVEESYASKAVHQRAKMNERRNTGQRTSITKMLGSAEHA